MLWMHIPADVDLIEELTGERLKNDKGEEQSQTFVEFMMTSALSDPEYFGKGLDALDMRNEIRDSLLKYRDADGNVRRARAGDLWGIESEWHKVLIKWVDKPSANYFPKFVGQMTSFLRAIKNAKAKKEDLTLPAQVPVPA